MSARGFGSLISAGAVAGAALGFYLVSLRVASERAALESVESEIALAQRDIRLLQTELGTRGRLAQLERWNVRFIRLSAPTADQFVDGGFQLATLVKPQARPVIDAPVVLAAAPIQSPDRPQLAGDNAAEPQPSRPVSEMVHIASYSAPQPRSVTPRTIVTPPGPMTVTVRTDITPAVKKTPATKPVKSATADPLAPLSPLKAKAKGEAATVAVKSGGGGSPSIQGQRNRLMNAPTPALVARPERLRLVGQRRQILAVMHQRLMLGMLVYGEIIAIIALRLIYLAAFGDHAGRKSGLVDLTPERGDIVDRDGQPLAQTLDAWTIGLHPAKLIGNKLDVAQKLAVLMPERDAATYLQMMRSGRTFYYLRRRAPPSLVDAVNALGEPGLALEREPDRLYPQTALAAHVVGYTDVDGNGTAGIERAFNDRLRDPSLRGQPITLSISNGIQQALEHELGDAMTHFSAIGAAGIIMDIHTGEVLAMTSLPQLNPNAAGLGSPEARFNRATSGVYEMGSTFKPFTVAMAMDAGTVKSMGQMYNCPQALHVAGRTINDTHPFGRACSVAEIMMESSNIGTAQIADQIGPARQKAFLKRMGFLDKVGIELKERGRTLTPGNDWNQIATMTVGYGHGIAVTPLHLATGYATLFNGGIYRPATLLKVDRTHGTAKGHRVFTEETSYKMRALLRLVVTQGTGKKADAPGYRVGGKTGTAEKLAGGRYTSAAVVTSFAGVFPMDEPRYVMVMMLDEPKSTAETYGFHTAGWNVAPAFSKTVSRIAPMLGVRPDKKREPNMAEVLPYVHEKAKR